MSPMPSIPTPGPLPVTEWQNRTTLDYATLYDHHAYDLLCLNTFIPVGAFGFYFWFGHQVFIMYSIYSWAKRKVEDKRKIVRSIIFGLLYLIYTGFIFFQNMKVLFSCSFWGIGKFAIPAVTAAVLAFGEIVLGMFFKRKQKMWGSNGEAVVKRFKVVAIVLLCAVLVCHQVSGLVYFVGVLRYRVGLEPFEFWDRVALDATMVSMIPAMAVGVFCLVLLGMGNRLSDRLYFHVRGHDHERKKWFEWIKLFCVDLFVVVVFAVVFSYGVFLFILATSEVMMGKIIGDPWGKVFFTTLLGKADVILISVFPILGGIVLFLVPASGGKLPA